MPKVSVLIPTRNHEKYIGECIQSVLDQSLEDFEIIITNDASTDKTAQIISKFKDPRIKLYSFKRNAGISAALNNCVNNAKGLYLAILNSDDVFLSNKLAIQVRYLETHSKIAAVFSYAQIINEKGADFTEKNHFYYDIFNQPNRSREDWLNYFFYHGNCLCTPSLLIRQSCYKNIGIQNPKLYASHDFDYWIRLCLQYDFFIIPLKLVKFRIRNKNANISAPKKETIIRHNNELGQILKNYLSIKSTDEFLKIFPQAKKYINMKGNGQIACALAQLALETDSPAHQYFGLNLLYDLASNNNCFSSMDYIQLNGKYDVFNIYALAQEKKKNEQLANRVKEITSSKLFKLWRPYCLLKKIVIN